MKRTRWIRVPAGRRHTIAAAALAGLVAGAAGAAAFYLARTLLARELLEEPDPRRGELPERTGGDV